MKKIRKLFKSLTALGIALAMVMSMVVDVNAEGKAVTVEITVAGLPESYSGVAVINFEKNADGTTITDDQNASVSENVVTFITTPGEYCTITPQSFEYDGDEYTADSIVIQLKNFEGNFVKTGTVTYSLAEEVDPPVVPPVVEPVVDIPSILGTDALGVEVETYKLTDAQVIAELEVQELVYISYENLQVDSTYYIKLEKSGQNPILFEGTFVPTQTTGIFNFVDEFGMFELTDKNNKNYKVSMSLDPTYPASDVDGVPNTLVDRFKIDSVVPTGDIVVNVVEDGKDLPITESLVGNDVILARAIDGVSPADTTYEAYLDSSNENGYDDAVKLIGHIRSDGTVAWDDPKEVLKIGGYILLVELPSGEGYTTNLEDPNPDDTELLLKEVQITRDTTVYRTIIIYQGIVGDPVTPNSDFSIFFDAGQGEFDDGSSLKDMPQTEGEGLNLPSDPTMPGMKFIGWFTEADGQGEKVDGNTVANSSRFNNQTVVAGWAVTLSYESSDEIMGYVTLDEETIHHTQGEPEGSTAVANPGYYFVEWINEDEEQVGTDPLYVPVKTFPPQSPNPNMFEEATYTAVFAELEHITINYVSNNTDWGTVSLASESINPEIGVPEGSTADPMPGYMFMGWYNEADELLSMDLAFMPEMNDDDMYEAATYTAMFQEMDPITIYYESNDETMGTVNLDMESLNPETGEPEGSTATAMPGYMFMGWYNEADELVSEDMMFMPEKVEGMYEAATYTAMFEELDPVAINYVSNNTTYGTVSVAMESINPVIGEPTGSLATAKSGFKFVKWVDETGKTVSTDPSFTPTKVDGMYEEATYTAIFEMIPIKSTNGVSGDSIVGTGDSSNIEMYGALLTVSLLGLFVALKKKRSDQES